VTRRHLPCEPQSASTSHSSGEHCNSFPTIVELLVLSSDHVNSVGLLQLYRVSQRKKEHQYSICNFLTNSNIST